MAENTKPGLFEKGGKLLFFFFFKASFRYYNDLFFCPAYQQKNIVCFNTIAQFGIIPFKTFIFIFHYEIFLMHFKGIFH